METSNWVLGDMAWVLIGGGVILVLLVLNSYVQRQARIDEEQRIALLASERLNRERSAASQSRRPDDIWRPGCLWNSACLPSDSKHTYFPRILPTVQNLTPSPPRGGGSVSPGHISKSPEKSPAAEDSENWEPSWGVFRGSISVFSIPTAAPAADRPTIFLSY